MGVDSEHFMRAVAELLGEGEALPDAVSEGLAAGREVHWAAHELIKRALLTPAQAAVLIRDLGDAPPPAAAAPPSPAAETVERDPQVRPPSDRQPRADTSRRSRVETATLTRRRQLGVGDELGERFRLEQEIGHGAQGVVYRAHDARLERDVAIKLLRTDAPGAARERFVREAQALSGIQHPGIVTVFDAGQQGNALYFAMELVQGRSLQALIDEEGGLEPTRLVPILERAAAAIHYAHDQGLVHRDLKPGNLLLDEDEVPRIVDFGLVALTEGTRLTVTRGVVGTPVYMAPEQAEGGAVTRRADVYSLGAILYEGLCGEPPFSGATPMEVFRQVVQDDPPPLRQRRPELSAALEAVCRRAMAKDPRARYPTALALARDLRLALEGDHVAAPGIGVVALGAWDRYQRRHPVLLGGALGFVLGALGGGAAVAGLTWRAEAPYRVDAPQGAEDAPERGRAENRARLLELAREERLRGDPEGAFDWLRFVLAEPLRAGDAEQRRQRVAALSHSALARLELGELGPAREALAQATDEARGETPLAVFHAAHAGLALAERQYTRLLRERDAALAADPEDPDALLIQVLDQRSDPRVRAHAAERLAARYPDAGWARYAQLLQAAQANAEAARSAARAVLEVAPDPERFPLAQALASEDPAVRAERFAAAEAHPRVDPRPLPTWR